MNERAGNNLVHRKTERRLLLAVDASENSRRAVEFVAHFFGNDKTIFISLLSIVPEPSEDFFPNDSERRQWLQDNENAMRNVLAGYKDLLLAGGIQEEQIEVRLSIKQCVSLADAILEEQEKQGCRIVVVGRRGLTHSEEFVFGSTSNKILHQAKHCAVMVIE